ncbi:MAG: four helix bundle protein [Candidatus Moranbacteria bacterium]|jgi:four helix bundle protein|nr:four helix bundle protein [Candidatus Moranbacteria bacterium]MDD5652253.1 four helix bundle protein [Candidatus Moranbacteria bacterium]MDX9856044.1 four helix bundle protein [Candidatus Moranbacteria bacterium]
MAEFSKKYDLEERTAVFGENVIELCKIIPHTDITIVIIRQLIRAATSIGANYMEANGASSKKDFRNKIFICKKEAQESKHWLRMLAKAHDNKKDEINELWQEAKELSMIFHKITSTIDKNDK